MNRSLVTSVLVAGLFVVGCASASRNNGATGGEGGAAGEGTGGSGTGGKATGGSVGSTGGVTGTGGSATGGVTGTGGSATGGAGGMSVQPDASAGPDGSGADAMSMMSGDGGGAGLGGEPFPGKDWIYLCPKAWNQTQCCDLLCRCLPALCSDSPQDASRFDGCMSMCTKLTLERARCQVYHCFESKNPGAVKDHASHCGHASGRVGGGSCTILGMQK